MLLLIDLLPLLFLFYLKTKLTPNNQNLRLFSLLKENFVSYLSLCLHLFCMFDNFIPIFNYYKSAMFIINCLSFL